VRRRATFVVALLALLPAPASGQCSMFGEVQCPLDAPRWVGEFATLSANALVGGLTAGLARTLRGGSFGDGFVRGALGGAVVYGGKRLAAERFEGAGLAGREVAAVGSSMVRNAADGAPLLERLVLPFGPVRLYVRPAARSVRPKLDALALGWTLYGVLESELTFDLGSSLSAGAPVFATDGKVIRTSGDTLHAGGLAVSGVILLADVPAFGDVFLARALAHERVHVLQGDHIFTMWTDPLWEWVLPELPGGRVVDSIADVDLSSAVFRLMAVLFPDHDDRPWELEAAFLAR
jgi:hypothetical protein